MGLFEDLTGACVLHIFSCAQSIKVSFLLLSSCRVYSQQTVSPPFHGTAETGYKFLFDLHSYPSVGFSVIWAGVISSSIPVSL